MITQIEYLINNCEEYCCSRCREVCEQLRSMNENELDHIRIVTQFDRNAMHLVEVIALRS